MYMQVWTSQLKRTVQSAQHLEGAIEQWKALNELDVVSVVIKCKNDQYLTSTEVTW